MENGRGIAMKSEKRDFDKEAANWDKQPLRVKLANDVANALLEEIAFTQPMDVLDFGCGTGLLTLRLQPLVRSIIGVDSSRGMLDVFGSKIKALSIQNIRTQHLDLENGDVLEGCFHLVISSMTFHHVKEIGPLLHRLHHVTAPGGFICIADLDPDEGKFHENNEGVFHFGFDRTVLRNELTEAGFTDVRTRTAATIMKPSLDGTMREFAVFLMTGKK